MTFSIKSMHNVIELNRAINGDYCFLCAIYEGMVFIPLLPLVEDMANIPRVEITEKALKILKIETALSGLGQKGTLEALVIRGASTQSLALVEEKAIIPKVESMPLMEVKEKEKVSQIPFVVHHLTPLEMEDLQKKMGKGDLKE